MLCPGWSGTQAWDTTGNFSLSAVPVFSRGRPGWHTPCRLGLLFPGLQELSVILRCPTVEKVGDRYRCAGEPPLHPVLLSESCDP